MLSFFKKKPPEEQADFGPTSVDTNKMSLDERKQWRNDMAKKSVHDALSAHELVSGMYRYRVHSLDERFHYFVVTIETTKHFAISKNTSTAKLAQIEETIKKIAFNSFNIVIEGVYWKANETVDVFEKAKEYKIPSSRPIRPIHEIAKEFKDTIPGWSDSAYSERDTYSREVDGKSYNTNLSPLDPE